MITSILKYSTMQCVIILCNVLSVTGLFPVFPVFPVVTPGVINVLEHSGGEGSLLISVPTMVTLSLLMTLQLGFI